jgi:DEAD/DEAH box helicase domain-containing protein
VVGYKKIKLSTFENIGFGDVNLPEHEMHTTCYWFTVDKDSLRRIGYSEEAIIYGLYGIAHIMGTIAPLFLLCSRKDIGVHIGDREGLWSYDREMSRYDKQSIEEMKRGLYTPTIFVYENYPGGVGFAFELFSIHPEPLVKAREEIRVCSCNSGCPSCVGPSIVPMIDSKQVALAILNLILEKEGSEAKG